MGYMPGPGPGLCEGVLPEGGTVLGDSLQYVGVEGAGIHIRDTLKFGGTLPLFIYLFYINLAADIQFLIYTTRRVPLLLSS